MPQMESYHAYANVWHKTPGNQLSVKLSVNLYLVNLIYSYLYNLVMSSKKNTM